MGLFDAIGKKASSKNVEKTIDEFTKKENYEQTLDYYNYITTNMDRVTKMIAELEINTKVLIDQIQAKKGAKLSFREKGDIRKIKHKAEKNLEYLYLIRDFFTALTKNRRGFALKKQELMLVGKFIPYFDGIPVLDVEDDGDDDDNSILGLYDLRDFYFEEYLYRYSEIIEEYIMPDIDSVIQDFKSTMAAPENSAFCTECGAPINPSFKFCSACGAKIE